MEPKFTISQFTSLKGGKRLFEDDDGIDEWGKTCCKRKGCCLIDR